MKELVFDGIIYFDDQGTILDSNHDVVGWVKGCEWGEYYVAEGVDREFDTLIHVNHDNAYMDAVYQVILNDRGF